MAFRTWGRVLLAALCVGVLVGAGQLGVAYGLGIIRFARTFDSAVINQFPSHLAWLSWFAMVATIAGALVGTRVARWYGHRPGLASQIGIAGVAAIGGAAVAPLSMLPARDAGLSSVDPALIAGVSAVLGAVVGLLAALAALSHPSVRWNITAIVSAIWVLALASVLSSLGPNDLPEVRLGALDPPWLGESAAQRLSVVMMPGLALVAGAATGALTRWLEQPMLVVATCGVTGPAMLALAYLIAGPGGSADRYQAAPYLGALIAAGTGTLGSVLAATLRWPVTGGDDDGEDGEGTAAPSAADPGAAAPGTAAPSTAAPSDPSETADPGVEVAGRQRAAASDRQPVAGVGTGDPAPTRAGTAVETPLVPSPLALSPLAGAPVAGAARPGTTAYEVPSAGKSQRDIPAPRRTPENDAYGKPPSPKPPVPPVSDPPPPTTADFWPDAGETTARATPPSPSQPPPSAPSPSQPPPSAPSPSQPPPSAPSPSRPSSPPPLAPAPRPAAASGPVTTPIARPFVGPAPRPIPRGAEPAPFVPTADSWDAFTPAASNTSTSGKPADTEPAGTTATGKRPTGKGPTGKRPTGKGPTGTETTGEGPTDREPTDREPTDRESGDKEPTGKEPSAKGQTGKETIGKEQTSGEVPTGEEPTGEESSRQQSTGGGRLRRALFRRNRSAEPDDAQRTGDTEAADAAAPDPLQPSTPREQRGRNRAEEAPLPAKDAEYVDWVSGLSAPAQPEEAAPEPGPRRSLRSSGRHHSE